MTKYRIILFLAILTMLPNVLFAVDFVIVVNNDNPVSSLQQSDAKKIFLGKKAFWDDGHKIDIYMQSENDLCKDFSSTILHKSSRQIKMYWRRALYSGTGLPPQKRPTDDEIKAEIAANPAAIGYIYRHSLDDTVKAVAILDDPKDED